MERQIAKTTCFFPCNDFAAEMSRIAFASKSSDKVLWSEPSPGRLQLHWTSASGDWITESYITPWRGVHPGGVGFLVLVGVAFALWLWMLIRRVFLPDLLCPPSLPSVNWQSLDEIDANYLVIGHPRSKKSSRIAALGNSPLIDLQIWLPASLENSSWKGWLPKVSVENCPRPIIILDHLEFGIADARLNQLKLALLEELLYIRRYRIIAISAVDPLYYLTAERHQALGADLSEAACNEILHHWARVLSRFDMVEFADTTCKDFEAAMTSFEAAHKSDASLSAIARLIREECSATAHLRRVGLQIIDDVEGKADEWPDNPDAFIVKLVDKQRPYFHALWSGFTSSERLVLYQLARDGWANPRNEEAIQQLQRREFIRRDGMLRIMNESFRRFLISVERPAEISEWERLEQTSAWKALRMGLTTVLLAIGCWLLYAHRDLFQVSIGYVAALGAAVTAVMNLLTNLRPRGSGS